MYNVHISDHVTCSHFHHPSWNTLATSFRLWFTLIQIVGPLVHHYWSITIEQGYDYSAIVYNLIRIHIHI